MFESLVLNVIQLIVNSILIEEQHAGFRSKRPTTLYNLMFDNYAYGSFQCRAKVDVIFIDFQKAFDSVNQMVLISYIFSTNLVLTTHYCLGLDPFLVTRTNELNFLMLSLICF